MAATKGNSGHVPMVDTYADEAPPSYDASHPDANRSAASGSTAPTTNSQPRTHHMNTAAQPQRISRPSGRTLPSGYVEIPRASTDSAVDAQGYRAAEDMSASRSRKPHRDECCFGTNGGCCFGDNDGCCFGDNGGCCFGDHGGCCFGDHGGCCFGRNKGCCFGDNGGCCFGTNGGCCFTDGGR